MRLNRLYFSCTTRHVSGVCRVETWNNLRRLLLSSGLWTTHWAHVSIVWVQTSVPGSLYCWHPVILLAVIWPLTDYWPHGHTPVWAMRGSKLISAIWGSFLHFSTFLLLSCYCPHIAHILIRFGFDRWLNSTPLWCNLKTQGVTIIFLRKNIFPMTLYPVKASPTVQCSASAVIERMGAR